MVDVPDDNGSYEFRPFHLDARQQRLRRDGTDIELTPTLFKILHFLVQHQGERLGKEDILTAVWVETSVTEDNLTRNISTLRTLLGDDPNDPKYIKTIHSFGYEFIAPVTKTQTPTPQSITASAALDAGTTVMKPVPTAPTIERPGRRLRHRGRVIAGLAILLLLISGIWWRWRRIDPHTLRVQVLSCDDECTLFLNDTEIMRTTLGQPPSAWRDITNLLRPGENELRLRVTNTVGAIAYGLRINKGGILVVQEQCGVAQEIGCNDNKTYPPGPVLDIVHTFHQ